MPVKVSVVVPVYNPGRDIDHCIQSLLGQSLPPDEFEAVFVDDGSTDDAPARLDALAAANPNVRVIHIPNSGWPGRPRNVGIASARGEYVQILDQDDRLGPEALERLYEMANRNRSDIVIGKVTSDFRKVPFDLFRRDRATCTLSDAPLVSSMTAHKLFRVAFLRERDVRFPEGRFVFEDHLFMVRAYCRASVVSVLASYPCYFYCERRDGVNTMSVRVDPSEYFAQMGIVVSEVRANTEPGDLRDRFLRRYHNEMLNQLGEAGMWNQPAFQAAAFNAIRKLDHEQFAGRSDVDLRPASRMRSMLLRDGAVDSIQELARRTAAVGARCRVEAVHRGGGRLRLDLDAGFSLGDDQRPMVLRRHDSRFLLDPALTDGIFADPIDVTDQLRSFGARASVRRPDDSVEWGLPTTATARFEEAGVDAEGWTIVRPRLAVTLTFDPSSAAAGGPLADGPWGLSLRLSGLGFERRVEIGAERTPTVDGSPMAAVIGHPARSVRPDFGPTGLVLNVSDPPDRRTVLALGHMSPVAGARRSATRLARQLGRRLPRPIRSGVRRVARRRRPG